MRHAAAVVVVAVEKQQGGLLLLTVARRCIVLRIDPPPTLATATLRPATLMVAVCATRASVAELATASVSLSATLHAATAPGMCL